MEVLYKELAKLEKANSFTSSSSASSSSSKGKAPVSIPNSLDTLLAQLHELRDSVATGSPDIDIRESLVKLPSFVEDRKKEIDDKQKEIYGSLNRYGKALDKKFSQSLPEFGELFTSETSQKALEKTIALHLIRTGQFAAADVLLEETNVDIPPETHAKFVELHNVLTALRSPDVQPALEWCYKNREFLTDRDSSLEFCLHRSQFIRLLLVSNPPDPNPAIAYARKYFSSLYPTYPREISRLMACVVYLPLKRLQASPYADLTAPSLHTDLESMFAIEYCARLGMSKQVPLRVVGDIGGGGALARIEKGRKVMRERKSEWSQKDELPIEIPISDENRYHSIFTCPVSREQATASNHPMMMSCGHVIARDSLNKMNKGGRVKCPYCPQESSFSDALQVYF